MVGEAIVVLIAVVVVIVLFLVLPIVSIGLGLSAVVSRETIPVWKTAFPMLVFGFIAGVAAIAGEYAWFAFWVAPAVAVLSSGLLLAKKCQNSGHRWWEAIVWMISLVSIVAAFLSHGHVGAPARAMDQVIEMSPRLAVTDFVNTNHPNGWSWFLPTDAGATCSGAWLTVTETLFTSELIALEADALEVDGWEVNRYVASEGSFGAGERSVWANRGSLVLNVEPGFYSLTKAGCSYQRPDPNEELVWEFEPVR